MGRAHGLGFPGVLQRLDENSGSFPISYMSFCSLHICHMGHFAVLDQNSYSNHREFPGGPVVRT